MCVRRPVAFSRVKEPRLAACALGGHRQSGGALQTLLLDHVVRQRDYHRYKARRLARAHHNPDKLSEALFTLAVATPTASISL